MKLTYRQIEPFVQKPDPAALVVLVYGPDHGLMKERASKIARSAVADINDPFNAVTMTVQQIMDDPARLPDEARAMSMMGGRRLIRVEDAGDKITSVIKDYLADPDPSTLIVLEASELGTKSSLRALCEKSAAAAAVPCYVEDERDITRLIRDTVQADKKQIDSDAVAWLAANITGDRLKARGEIEKLLLYKGAEPGAITLEDVRAACGEAGAQGLDDLVYNVGKRDAAAALKVLGQLWAEGTPFIVVLRSLQNHFRRLHITRARIDAGEGAETAMKSLSPPVFFKQEALFRAQTQSWGLSSLANCLRRLHDLEAQCKQTGIPAETLCAQAVLGISSMKA
jgi:DNA polymerase-3 subunit delta